MRYHDAIEATVTLQEALAELRRHRVAAHVRDTDRALIDTETGELIAEADEWGDYSGGDVIGHLGY